MKTLKVLDPGEFERDPWAVYEDPQNDDGGVFVSLEVPPSPPLPPTPAPQPTVATEWRYPVFQPLTQSQTDDLFARVKANTGLDLTWIPVKTARPGEAHFDVFEVQHKLHEKYRNWDRVAFILSKAGYRFNPEEDGAAELARKVAREHEIRLNDFLPQLAYNISNKRLLFPAVRTDIVPEVAELNAHRENEEWRTFPDEQAARDYLTFLSARHFFHELGHIVHARLLSDDLRNYWSHFISKRPALQEQVRETQKNKHPSPESVPVESEAFADLFSHRASGMESPLGNQEKPLIMAGDLVAEVCRSLTPPLPHRSQQA
jgi:hypothetical protein